MCYYRISAYLKNIKQTHIIYRTISNFYKVPEYLLNLFNYQIRNFKYFLLFYFDREYRILIFSHLSSLIITFLYLGKIQEETH